MNKILLIEDDERVTYSIVEALKDYEIIVSKTPYEAKSLIKEKSPSLVIFDYDVKNIDPIKEFKVLRSVFPDIRVIMISGEARIDAAVIAAKQGVYDFLRKPLEVDKLKQAVIKTLRSSEERDVLDLSLIPDSEWLNGENSKLHDFLSDLQGEIFNKNDLILFSEKGVSKDAVALVLHLHGRNRKRRLITINLSSFSSEASEGHFWGALQEMLLLSKDLSLEEDICGTIYLKEFESISEHFEQSILKFLFERKQETNVGKVDTSIKVIIEAQDPLRLLELDKKGFLSSFSRLDVISLRDRKDDIPILIKAYLDKYSNQFNKKIENISLSVLKFIMAYNWPGNYAELENLIRLAVLNTKNSTIDVRDLPLSFKMIQNASLSKFALKGSSLIKLREEFDKEVYVKVLEKVLWDRDRAALFLDVPKTILEKRLNELGVKFPL